MTAVEIAREFSNLRTLQRLLRLYETTHGNVHDIARLRLHVITEMRKLAKLATYGLPLLLLFTTASFAQHSHDLHHALYQDWVNKLDEGCCNNKDCGQLAEQNERVTVAGTVEVNIEGVWCPVLPHHYLKKGNAPDWSTSHVCVQKATIPGQPACQRLLCYQPKPGA